MAGTPEFQPKVSFQAEEIRRQAGQVSDGVLVARDIPAWTKHAKEVLDADKEQINTKLSRLGLIQDAAAYSVRVVLQEEGIIKADKKHIKRTLEQRAHIMAQLTDEEKDIAGQIMRDGLERIYESRTTS